MAGYFREKNIERGLEVFQEMKLAGVNPDSHSFTHLINMCSTEEDIVKVIQEKGIPFKNLYEIKSVLITDLAEHNQMSDALDLYEEIKQNGGNIEFKAIMNLIEHFPPGGDIKTLH